MPATCEGCRYYSAENQSGPCPACGRPLKFTLLPPPDTDPPPLDLPPADEPRPLRRADRDAAAPGPPLLYDLVTSTPFLAVVGVALFVVLLGLLWAGIQQGQEATMPKPK